MTAFGEMFAFVLHILIDLRSLKNCTWEGKKILSKQRLGWKGKLKTGLGSVGGTRVLGEFLRQG